VEGFVLNEWSKVTCNLLEELQKLKPKDRLSLVSSIVGCNVALARSVNGWAAWLTDPRIMNKLSESDLQKYYKKFSEITKQFLELDKEITTKYGAKKPEDTKSNTLVI